MPKFGPNNPGNRNGRPPGIPNKATVLRNALYDCLPEIIEAVKREALNGDMGAAKLLLERTIPPVKAVHQPVPLPISKITPDEEAADMIYQSAIDGELDSDHAASLLHLIGTKRQLVADIAVSQVPPQGDTGPLEQLETVTGAALQSGRLDLAVRAASAQLPYRLAKKEPDPPKPVGRVEAEPIGLDGEEWERKYGGDNG